MLQRMTPTLNPPTFTMPSMDLRQTKSTPNLRKHASSPHINRSKLERQTDQLEELIDGMFLEYEFMDHPKDPLKEKRPFSLTLTIDQILWTLLTT